LHTFYYVRPNKTVEHGTLGVDYFTDAKDVIRYEMKMEGLLCSDSDKEEEPNTSNRAHRLARISLSPASSRATSSKKQRQSKRTEWWHAKALPSYIHDVWPVLRDQLHFRYSSGCYLLPVSTGDNQRFSTDKHLRSFLIRKGVPNWDKLEKEEAKQTLDRWLRFAHVPVNDINSVSKLEDVDVLEDEEALELLFKLGMTKKGEYGSYHLPNGDICSTVAEVRVHVRQTESFEKEATTRRAARGGAIIALTSDEMLNLRLWGATCKDPLPVWDE
jgi:hypothetical protein